MRDRRRETETQKARNSRMKMLALCQFVPFSSNTMAPLFPDILKMPSADIQKLLFYNSWWQKQLCKIEYIHKESFRCCPLDGCLSITIPYCRCHLQSSNTAGKCNWNVCRKPKALVYLRCFLNYWAKCSADCQHASLWLPVPFKWTLGLLIATHLQRNTF